MPEPTKARRGGSRPNTGGKRPGAGAKRKGEKSRSCILSVRTEQDVADWLKHNGGSALHYQILRDAFIKAHIV